MKKILLPLLGMLLMLSADARDFKYEYRGQTLTYTVIDEDAKTCKTADSYETYVPPTSTSDGYYEDHPGNDVSGDLIIPPVAKDGETEFTVIELGNYAFAKCTGLTSVEIPNTVPLILNYAFEDCSNLTSFVIPSSVIFVDQTVFKGCTGLKKSAFPDNFKRNPFYYQPIGSQECTHYGESVAYPANDAIIENNVVYGSGKTALYFVPCYIKGEFTIPETVTTIGYMAFSKCTSLTSIGIPNSVTTISSWAFKGCTGLSSLVIGNSVESIGDQAFRDCIGLTSLVIPNSVTSIGATAFDCCTGLTSVLIGNSVESIGWGAFRNCTGLTSVVLGEKVTSIFNYAYEGCTALTSLKCLSETPAYFGDRTFADLYDKATLIVPDGSINDYLATKWSLFKNIKLRDSGRELKTYSDGVLNYRLIPAAKEGDKNLAVIISGDYANLTEVMVPESITVEAEGAEAVRYYVDGIGYKAFDSCSNLSSVTFDNQNELKVIGDYAFAETAIESVSIPSSVKSIGDYAFYKTAITEIEVPSSVKSIGDYAFNSVKLKKVVLTEGLETIGSNAFSGRSEWLYIPSTLKSVGESAFAGFYCLNCKISDLAAWCKIDFANGYSLPTAAYEFSLYLNDNKIEDLVIPETIESIKNYAFYGINLKSVTFPKGLKSIGDGAFVLSSGLSSVTFPEGLQSIGDNAFGTCRDLTTIVIPNSVTTIGCRAFAGCTGLTSVVIGDNVTSIGDDSFRSCDNLTTLVIGKSVTSLGDEAFAYCQALAEIYYDTTEPVEANKNIFNENIYKTATLYVAEGGLENAHVTMPWGYFQKIREKEYDGVEDVITDTDKGDIDFNAPVEVYNLQGLMVGDSIEGLAYGIYIVRQGLNVKKIAVK